MFQVSILFKLPYKMYITLNPFTTFLYLAGLTCKRHLTKSKGVTSVCVIPHDKIPPRPHKA